MLKNLTKNVIRLTLALLFVLNLSVFAGLPMQTASADFCSDLQSEFQGFLDCDDKFTSFTDFDGGLEAPDSSGFDSNLTRAGDARTFAKNVANFALGFLGLIAVLIIIYSGFLYVTSRGEDSQMEKGKKGITSALIGIIIILSSFAIVNTVIQAPGGDSSNIDDGRGVAPGQGTNIAQIENYNAAAEEVADLTRDLISKFEKYNSSQIRLQKLKTFKPDKFTSRRDFVEYLEFMKDELRALQNSSGSLSNAGLAAQAVIDNVLDPGIQVINNVVQEEERQEFSDAVLENNTGNFFDGLVDGVVTGWQDNFGTRRQGLANLECALPAEERSVEFDLADGAQNDNLFNSNLGSEIDDAFDDLIQRVVIEEGINRDFNEDLDLYVLRLKNIRRLLTPNSGDTLPFNPGLDDLFVDTIAPMAGESCSSESQLEDPYCFETATSELRAENMVSAYSVPETGDDFLTNFGVGSDGNFNYGQEALAKIKAHVQTLQKLYDQLNNITFTAPVITANTFRGSAPLIITFDGSNSYDPAARTITDSQYSWDPDGDGDDGVNTTSSGVDCESNNENASGLESASITCIFTKPGSYTTSLTIDSNTPDTVAPGIAYAQVRVLPPVSRIDLTANVQGQEYVLKRYAENGTVETDLDEIEVILSESRDSGPITFDASGTKGNEIVNYEWFFTNYEEQPSGSTKTEAKVQYFERGNYDAYLAVEDEQGNIDRKFFRINVKSIVARILPSFTRGTPGTEFTFDGSRSAADLGGIQSYSWKVNGEEITDEDSETLRYIFDTPGTNIVVLEVTDSEGNIATDDQTVFIESQPPQAIFSANANDPSQPSLFVFDASQSFDPDPNDSLKYNWRIFNATENIDYVILDGDFSSSEKVTVLFKKKGSYKVELRVDETRDDTRGDQTDPFLYKSSTTSQDVYVNSLVDVKFAEGQSFAAQLNDELEAEVEFEVESRFADTVEIDFGDGDDDEERLDEGSDGIGKATFKHTYDSAGRYDIVITGKNGNDKNTASARLIVGGGDEPVAVPVIKVGESVYNNVEDLPTFYKGKEIVFDASGSLSSRGTTTGLTYEWNFGDGDFASPANGRTTHVYKDLPPNDGEVFKVSLVVSDGTGESSTVEFDLPITGAKPRAQSLLVTPIGGNKTPVTVKAEVIGASDDDGRITQYRFYYFPLNDPEREFDVQITNIPTATLTVSTFGLENDEIEYGFCVDLTDDEGNTVTCRQLFDEGNIRTMTAVNGPNEPPTAKFEVDFTSANVGQNINFFSSSTDPDGEIIEFTYDFDGDGSFVNNVPSAEGNQSHVFTKKSPASGFNVRLKVLDDKGATAVSAPIKIYIDSVLNAPKAAFVYNENMLDVQFRNNSEADTEHGGRIAEYEWDFDLNEDSDGDGDPANDVDSADEDPEHTYKRSGVYRVQLTVKDNEFNEDSVIRELVIQDIPDAANNPIDDLVGGGGVIDQTRNLIDSVPPANPATDIITLSGSSAPVTLRFNNLGIDVAEVLIDQDVYFDTNSGAPGTPGDGVRNNDVDYRSNTLTQWTSPSYKPEMQPIRIQVTIIDRAGNVYSDQVDVVFAGSSLQAALTLALGENIAIAAYIALLVLGLAFGAGFIRRDKNKKSKLM